MSNGDIFEVIESRSETREREDEEMSCLVAAVGGQPCCSPHKQRSQGADT